MSELSVATWNLKCLGGEAACDRKLDYLADTRWDLACLQEVNEAASGSLARRDDWVVVDGLRLAFEQVRSWRNPHGAAIVARNGWRLDAGDLIADTPTPGRGVTAVARRPGVTVSVISWHAPNAAGEGVEVKMAGYRAMLEAVDRLDRPLVLGLDSNHWSPGIDLDLPPPPEPNDPFEVENRFFSRDPQHPLHDALIVYLRGHPDLFDDVRRSRPEGPLAVSHVRGRAATRIADRFDYVMVSEEFDVLEVTYDYPGAVNAGSDHALVCAQLAIDRG
jgi:endonuclease/exonuclease/phosphatase family metal-dependent hydrolase